MTLASKLITLTIICILIILFWFLLSLLLSIDKNTNKVETYSTSPKNLDSKMTSSTVHQFMREYGIESISALYDLVEGSYVEDFSPIMEDRTLTLYYSTFSKTSLPVEQTRIFYNISPYFKDAKKPQCKYLQFDNSHIHFIEPPYANRNMGVELLTNTANGPPSHLLGIQGNGTFTLFSVLRFNGFSMNNGEEYEVFKLYGNTEKNNALSLTIDSLPESKDANSANVRFKLHFSTQVISINYEGSDHFPIEFSKAYMIVITKLNKKISFNLHDLSRDLSYNTTHKLIDNVELSDPNAFFSNKEISFNAMRNMNANMFAFGVYNMYIMDESSLHHYMYKEMYKSSDEFLREARQILSFQKEIDEIRECPYDSSVCDICSGVGDWTNINNIIDSSVKCRKAIDNYCSENVDDPKCMCWKAGEGASQVCKSYVNIFRSMRMIDLDNIDEPTRIELSKKYKFCDCDPIRQEDQDGTSPENRNRNNNGVSDGTGTEMKDGMESDNKDGRESANSERLRYRMGMGMRDGMEPENRYGSESANSNRVSDRMGMGNDNRDPIPSPLNPSNPTYEISLIQKLANPTLTGDERQAFIDEIQRLQKSRQDRLEQTNKNNNISAPVSDSYEDLLAQSLLKRLASPVLTSDELKALTEELLTIKRSTLKKNNIGNEFDLPPIHKLTSPHLKSGPVETNRSDEQCNVSRSLLKDVPPDVLPHVTHERLRHIASSPIAYKGEEQDITNFNSQLESDPNSKDPYDDVQKSSDYRYGETDLQPERGFWSWLLNR